MIFQDGGESEGHPNGQPRLMDWWQGLPEISIQPTAADPPAITTQDDWKLKETSSYGKSSCILPVSFFDIQSNIQLLNECNPLSIKIVDCDKYPWYYKKYTRSYAQESASKNMTDHSEPSKVPTAKLADISTENCIDLTNSSDNDIPTNNNGTMKYTVNLNKIIINNNNNKTSHMTGTKIKSRKGPNRLTKEDLEKRKACSQVNLSKIDLKHNTGLVGLKITQAIGLNLMLPNKKRKKNRKNKKQMNIEKNKNRLPVNKENDKTDECISLASKTLGLLGTLVLPVTNQEQNQNISKDSPNKNCLPKVPSQHSVQISVSKPIVPNHSKPKLNQKNNCHGLGSPVPPPVTTNYNKKSIGEPKTTQELVKKTDDNVQVKQETVIHDSKEDIPEDSLRQIKNVDNKEPYLPKDERNEKKTNVHCTGDTTLRSKSPIFPCNKQKMQSELEKHLTNERHIEPKNYIKYPNSAKDSEVVNSCEKIMFVKDWPKPVPEIKQVPPNASQPLQGYVNKTANNNLNISQTDQINTLKHTNKDTLTNRKPEKRKMGNALTVKPLKDMLKCPERSPQVPVTNLQVDQAMHKEINKNVTLAKDINFKSNNNKSQIKKTLNNVENSTKKTSLDAHLVALYQNHFAKAPASENKAKAPPPKVRPPVQTVAPNIHKPPQQTQVSNVQGANMYPGAVTSQNSNACLPNQQIPVHASAYCKVNGMPINIAQPSNCYPTNDSGCGLNMGNTSMCYAGRGPLLLPQFIYPPPTFVPPPPIPTSFTELQNFINSFQNLTNKPCQEAKTNVAKKLNDNENVSFTTSATNNFENIKTGSDVKSAGNAPVLNVNDPNRSPADKTERNEQNKPSRKAHLPRIANNPNIILVHKTKSTVVIDKHSKDNLSKKEDHNSYDEFILGDLTITPVAKPNEANSSLQSVNRVSEKNKTDAIKLNNKSINEKINNNSLSEIDNNSVPPKGKNQTKPRAGPLCMKNRTGPFAENKASSPPELKIPSAHIAPQPKKGYSPPILPIPTFHTALAHNELERIRRQKAKEKTVIHPVTNLHLYPAVQNRIPNANISDKDSRKRLHFDEKNANEGKEIKKISLEDYKNRSFCASNDPYNMPGRKHPRKGESTKSVTSLADVVNKNVVYEL